jgi:multimeric flavodoxin WrbA
MKKIVAFSGSPRKNGNTETLLNRILDGAREEGAETKLIRISDLNIIGCQACSYCRRKAGCALQDAMQELYQEIKNADAIVIGSPIYMWQMSSQTKAFVDRFFAFYQTSYGSDIREKPCILAFTYNMPSGEYDAYVDFTAGVMKLFVDVRETISAGNGEKGIAGQIKILDRAYSIGRSLASVG